MNFLSLDNICFPVILNFSNRNGSIYSVYYRTKIYPKSKSLSVWNNLYNHTQFNMYIWL